jgi:hypothetical protein
VSPRVVKGLGGPLLGVLVRRVLVGWQVGGVAGGRTLTRAEVGRILGHLWAHFDDLAPGIPGSRPSVRA